MTLPSSVDPATHQACLDSLKRTYSYLDETALGSEEVRQYIPAPQKRFLHARLRELQAQHVVLDWTTTFPTMYYKKSVKAFIAKTTLPHKCRSLEKAAQKWRKEADLAYKLADRECQRVRKERLDRFKQERPVPVFNRHAVYEGRSLTMSEFSVPRWEGRIGADSNQSLPMDDTQSRAAVPWFFTDGDDCTLPSPVASSRRSTISDPKRPTPWLTRTPSGTSIRENPSMTEILRIRTASTSHIMAI